MGLVSHLVCTSIMILVISLAITVSDCIWGLGFRAGVAPTERPYELQSILRIAGHD